MSAVSTLLETYRHQGITLRLGENGKVQVNPPAEQLPQESVEELRRNKEEIRTALMQQQGEEEKPFLNSQGELIIPFDSDPRYHWWAGGQSVAETLAEFNASLDERSKYIGGSLDKRSSR